MNTALVKFVDEMPGNRMVCWDGTLDKLYMLQQIAEHVERRGWRNGRAKIVDGVLTALGDSLHPVDQGFEVVFDLRNVRETYGRVRWLLTDREIETLQKTFL